MITKIKYNNDFLETEFTQEDINMAIVDKINEIIEVVNRLDVEIQKMPPASKIHMDLFGRGCEC